jgi:hypothetical protein
MQPIDKSSSLATSNSPALQLVSEIFESLKVKNVKNDSRRDNDSSLERPVVTERNKKSHSLEAHSQAPTSENFEVLKSRLKKVSKSVDEPKENVDNGSEQDGKRTSGAHDPEELGAEQNGKEKRSSTGSITNLKRLWESQRNVSETGTTSGYKPPKNITKETGDSASSGRGAVRTSDSPGRQDKVSPKSETEIEDRLKLDEKRAIHDKTPKSNVGNPKTDKNKPVKIKRVWPPQSLSNDTDKPAVPTKPFVSKKTNPIYATPSQRVDHSSRGMNLS